MIEDLNYIYMASYWLDVFKSFSTGMWVLLFISIVIMAPISINIDIASTEKEKSGLRPWRNRFIVAGLLLILTPSERTLKLYIGVKASQKALVYMDKTDIPERAKATLDGLWDKIDETIGVKETKVEK